ncbi:DUF4198 domain-containing protein [Candidatus Pelagibacter bacterium]|nr:DUF4198 domain-containing protein [Candidatus Pelagibacter bacterium]MDB2709520.1 DUF4198 domain-containing protein [Candidatus Pelagibacter bacterium]
MKFDSHAHELWLEPINFKFNNNEVSKIHIKVGQNFNGSPFGYYDPNKKSLYLENKNKVINLPQRDGNFPAIQTLILDKGFHVLTYETNYEFLKYESIEKFEDFLKEQNFESTLEKFDKNKLPTESYRRFAKALMTNGNKSFFIQKPKLDFEIIALTSPYNLKEEIFEFQLFEKGNPLENWQITTFSRDEVNSYKEIVKTNPNGVGKIRIFENRTYLLSAVKLDKANYLEKLKYKSDWFSLWASLTFKK